MTFPLHLVASVGPHRVVPIRFVRATQGRANSRFPDLDDRGFVSTAGGRARGPALGLTTGQEARVKVVRDRLSPAAPLFATVDDPSVVVIRRPVGSALDPVLPTVPVGVPDGSGTRLTEEPVGGDWYAADTIDLSAQATSDDVRETTLRVRYGSSTGPVLGELFLRVYGRLTVRVKLHIVRIAAQHVSNFIGPTTTSTGVLENLHRVGEIFAQAGLAIEVAPDVVTHDIHLARAGEVHEPDAGQSESPRVFALAPQQGHLNVYAIHRFREGDGLDGLGTNRRWGSQAGLIVTDFDHGEWYATQVTAHEMGHAFGLEHYALGNDSNHSRNDQREDIWARRNLMWNGNAAHPHRNFYHASPARAYNGYPRDARPGEGGGLGCKHLSALRQSDQVAVIRDTIRRNLHAPARHGHP